jgi:hypothetical protein
MAAHPLMKFTGVLTEKYWPTVPCPTCGNGNLKLMGPVNDIWASYVETAPAYPPQHQLDMGGVFHATLRCDESTCQEGAVVAGSMFVDEQWEWPNEDRYQTFYKVKFVEPALRLFDVPADTPEAVKAGIAGASAVMWSSPGSAANRLRYAVEEILTAEGIPAKKPTGGRLSAGERIKLYEKKDHDLAKGLEAVKWIGNEGSHEEVLTVPHVIEDAEILGHVVTALYGKQNEALAAKIKTIIDAQGIAPKGP